MKKFDVCNIEINGKNLIEASAGTGKTYSIALLVLRLLLEKSIGIEKMLIVTFTNAAVAELDIRIRKFLYQAYNIARNKSENEDKNPDLEFIVKRSVSSFGQQKTEELLRNAILFLDEISIFTIHSFCQSTLTDNAFESGLLFNTEIIEDQTEIIEKESHRYWRTNITMLDKSLLKVLMGKDFSPGLIVKIFGEVNSGKKLRIKNLYNLNELPDIIVKHQKELEQKISDLKDSIIAEWEFIKSIKFRKNTKIEKAVNGNSIDNFYSELISAFRENKVSILEKVSFLNGEEIIRAEEEFDLFKTDILSIVLNDAVSKISDEVEVIKNRNKVLSFNDMISKLYSALVEKNNLALYRKLNTKYKAVFIDEFQDTDQLQYKIFQKAFGEGSKAVLFFIGDPKQSIYGWRGADLEMYSEAKKNIEPDRFFNMESNFRSTPKLLQSINEFFKADEGSQTLKVKNDENEFSYYNVTAGNNELGDLMGESGFSNPFEIIVDSFGPNKWNKKDQLMASAGEIAEMLNTHKIVKAGSTERLKPNDIGVLCRKNDEARKFKELLTNFNIPSVIVDDTKIIDTKEATDLYYLLFGILNISESNISRALLSSFTGYTTDQIQVLNFEKHYDIFSELQKTWKNSGIFSLIIEFLNKYNIRNYLIFSNNLNGERVYTNLMHLTQILNEKETYDKLTPERLIDWFQKARQGEKSFNKYEQQIESDEDSVQIVTVHKSKGLAYKIVVLPYFNLEAKIAKKEKIPFIDYREGSSRVISFYWDEFEKELKKKQENEENRRLLYVAITRAVYKCLVNYNEGSKGILNEYMNKIRKDNDNFVFRTALNPNQKYKRLSKDILDFVPPKFAAGIDKSWVVTSFSNLNYVGEIPKSFSDQTTDLTDPYDKFIFSDLKKGAQMGLMIHEIFEKLNFENSERWKKLIVSVLKKYTGNTEEKHLHYFELMIRNVLNTELHPLGFRLSNIRSDRKLSELEFYFTVDNLKSDSINSLIPDLNLSYTEIRGIMHGLIDLVFEFDGKYYILDWKTNHIGNTTRYYESERLEQIITDNNYHLQYLIYTIALKRYLTEKISGFSYSKHFGGVFYLFIRGIRTGKPTGIYYKKPDESLIIKLEKMMHK